MKAARLRLNAPLRMKIMATDLNPALNTVGDDIDGSKDLTKYQATPGPSCSTTLSDNNRTDKKPERLSQCKQPFPILRLPREIRDQIYRYGLCATHEVDCSPGSYPFGKPEDGVFKPLTPGLLRTSKQIYRKAKEIFYSENIFKFRYPKYLVDFWKQIGPENRKRVRQICVWNKPSCEGEVVPDPKDLPLTDLLSCPSHWGAAFASCDFEKIVHLSVEANLINARKDIPFGVSKDLREFIEKVFERVPENEVPRLSLMGYDEKEREKFPRKWKIVMHRPNNEEVRMQLRP